MNSRFWYVFLCILIKSQHFKMVIYIVTLKLVISCIMVHFSFVLYLSIRASDKCQKEKRKTVNGDDLLWAMATLGFEEYINPLKAYLSRYREV